MVNGLMLEFLAIICSSWRVLILIVFKESSHGDLLLKANCLGNMLLANIGNISSLLTNIIADILLCCRHQLWIWVILQLLTFLKNNNKHLLDEAEPNILNCYAFVGNGGRRRRWSPSLPKKHNNFMLVEVESK